MLCVFASFRVAFAEPRNTLWYRQPAQKWTEALPVGNGRLGGMVFGGVGEERIQLNEDSLWSGGPQDGDNPDALRWLPEIRRLLFAGEYAKAQELTYQKLVCKGPGSSAGAKGSFGSYETLGDLKLTFDHGPAATNYRRELNLDDAIASVTYKVGEATYRREVFSSFPDQLLIVRITCDQPTSVGFRLITSDANEIGRAHV